MALIDIEQAITEMYEELIRRNPEITAYKVCISAALLKAAGWHEGQRITEYNLPVMANPKMKETDLGNGDYQSDIWVVNEDY